VDGRKGLDEAGAERRPWPRITPLDAAPIRAGQAGEQLRGHMDSDRLRKYRPVGRFEGLILGRICVGRAALWTPHQGPNRVSTPGAPALRVPPTRSHLPVGTRSEQHTQHHPRRDCAISKHPPNTKYAKRDRGQPYPNTSADFVQRKTTPSSICAFADIIVHNTNDLKCGNARSHWPAILKNPERTVNVKMNRPHADTRQSLEFPAFDLRSNPIHVFADGRCCLHDVRGQFYPCSSDVAVHGQQVRMQPNAYDPAHR